jgi:hypothetical protein
MEREEVPLLPSLDVVLSETKAALEDQSERLSSLDTKLGVLLGLSGVILAALLVFPLTYNVDIATRWLLIAAVALILASLLSATWGYWIRKYKAPPSPSALREFYLMEEPQKAKLAVVDYLCSVYDWNQKLLESKVRFTHGSFIFVLLGALIIGVTILLNLL